MGAVALNRSTKLMGEVKSKLPNTVQQVNEIGSMFN